MQTQTKAAPAPPILFAAPHRTMFFSGGVMLLVAFVLWAFELAGRVGAVAPLPWTLPPGWMHALLVLAGVFPLFMFGFLLTAMPRWQGAQDLPAAVWLLPWRLLVAGWAVATLGLWIPGLLAAGLLLVLAGWGGVLRVLWGVAFNDNPDSLHARLVTTALAAGGFGVLAWFVFALTGDGVWARVAISLGVWWCLLPVFFTVCHRMIPFFSSNIVKDYVVVRPRWALGIVLGASVIHGALAMAGFGAMTWIVDAPAAATALWLSVQWRLVPALRVPLLGMLHIGFAWLGIAFLLSTLQGVAALFGHAWLGLAPLHALGVGFFGSVLLGMVSRVTLGHSGGKLVADKLTWSLFLGLELVVVVRVAGELVPPSWSNGVMLAAALGWIGVFGLWGTRYLPVYLRPRSDGRPG